MRRLLYAIIVLTMMVSTLSLAQGGGQGGGGGPGGGGGGGLSGMTTNRLQKAASASTLASSCLSDDGTTVTNNCTGGIASSGTPGVVGTPGTTPFTLTTGQVGAFLNSTGNRWGQQAYGGSFYNFLLASDLPLGPASGGTGVANNAASTITLSGAYGLTLTLTGATSVTLPASGTLTQTIASGALALATSSISSGACQTVTQGSVNSAAATGTATTDVITFTPNGSIKALTGYTPATTGGLTIAAYPTAGYVNFDVCNWTSGAITPSALTINWRVVR